MHALGQKKFGFLSKNSLSLIFLSVLKKILEREKKQHLNRKVLLHVLVLYTFIKAQVC